MKLIKFNAQNNKFLNNFQLKKMIEIDNWVWWSANAVIDQAAIRKWMNRTEQWLSCTTRYPSHLHNLFLLSTDNNNAYETGNFVRKDEWSLFSGSISISWIN